MIEKLKANLSDSDEKYNLMETDLTKKNLLQLATYDEIFRQLKQHIHDLESKPIYDKHILVQKHESEIFGLEE